jgi:osmotically-inducible protein OsmY
MRRALLCALLCGALAVACGQNADTKANVRNALDQANIANVDVDVDRNANIVHLKGTVGTIADRTRAEEIANAAVGTSGRVLNELTVEGLNAGTADDLDDDIEDGLDRMLDKDPVLKERDINFEVHNGMVAIKGEVRSADEKNRVGQLVAAAAGVKDVANGLVIRNSQ